MKQIYKFIKIWLKIHIQSTFNKKKPLLDIQLFWFKGHKTLVLLLVELGESCITILFLFPDCSKTIT